MPAALMRSCAASSAAAIPGWRLIETRSVACPALTPRSATSRRSSRASFSSTGRSRPATSTSLIVNIVNYSSTRPWRVLGAWGVLLALGAAAIAFLLFDGLDAEARVPQSAETDSQRVEELLERRLPQALREDVELLVLRDDDVAG